MYKRQPPWRGGTPPPPGGGPPGLKKGPMGRLWTPKNAHFWHTQGGTLGCDKLRAGFYVEIAFFRPDFPRSTRVRGVSTAKRGVWEAPPPSWGGYPPVMTSYPHFSGLLGPFGPFWSLERALFHRPPRAKDPHFCGFYMNLSKKGALPQIGCGGKI